MRLIVKASRVAPFYSHLSQALESLPKRATPRQIEAHAEKAGHGPKSDERVYTGFNDWVGRARAQSGERALDTEPLKRKVQRGALRVKQAWLVQRGTLTDPTYDTRRRKLEDQRFLASSKRAHARLQLVQALHEHVPATRNGDAYHIAEEAHAPGTAEWMRSVLPPEKHGLIQAAAEAHAKVERLNEKQVSPRLPVKVRDRDVVGGPGWGNYTLPGGTNYREMLLRHVGKPQVAWEEKPSTGEHVAHIPGKSVAARVKHHPAGEGWNAHYEISVGSNTERRPEIGSLGAAKRYAERRLAREGFYKSSHWKPGNVLAHARMKDRTDDEGAHGLHVEEIQSDWHQQGRDAGYGDLKSPQGALVQAKEHARQAREHHRHYTRLRQEMHQGERTQALRGEYREASNRSDEALNHLVDAMGKHPFYSENPGKLVSHWKILQTRRAPEDFPMDAFKEHYQRFAQAESQAGSAYRTLTAHQQKLGKRVDAHSQQAQEHVQKYNEAMQRNSVEAPDAPFKDTKAWTKLSLRHLLQHAVQSGHAQVTWSQGHHLAEVLGPGAYLRGLTFSRHPAEEGKFKVGFLYNEEGAVDSHRVMGEDELRKAVGRHIAQHITEHPKGRGRLSPAQMHTLFTRGTSPYYDKLVPSVMKEIVGRHSTVDRTRINTGTAEAPRWEEVHRVKITPELREHILTHGQPLAKALPREVGQARVRGWRTDGSGEGNSFGQGSFYFTDPHAVMQGARRGRAFRRKDLEFQHLLHVEHADGLPAEELYGQWFKDRGPRFAERVGAMISRKRPDLKIDPEQHYQVGVDYLVGREARRRGYDGIRYGAEEGELQDLHQVKPRLRKSAVLYVRPRPKGAQTMPEALGAHYGTLKDPGVAALQDHKSFIGPGGEVYGHIGANTHHTTLMNLSHLEGIPQGGVTLENMLEHHRLVRVNHSVGRELSFEAHHALTPEQQHSVEEIARAHQQAGGESVTGIFNAGGKLQHFALDHRDLYGMGKGRQSLYKALSLRQARAVGERLGVDWEKISPEAFRQGMEVEGEHRDVTRGSLLQTGKIAHTHLRERPDYYTLLEKYVEDAPQAKSLRFVVKRQGNPDFENMTQEELARHLGY